MVNIANRATQFLHFSDDLLQQLLEVVEELFISSTISDRTCFKVGLFTSCIRLLRFEAAVYVMTHSDFLIFLITEPKSIPLALLLRVTLPSPIVLLIFFFNIFLDDVREGSCSPDTSIFMVIPLKDTLIIQRIASLNILILLQLLLLLVYVLSLLVEIVKIFLIVKGINELI